MKTLLKIIGIIVIIIIVLMLLLPVIFKGKIVELAKEEINKNVKAKVDFTDFSLSLFRNFPNFSFGIEGLTVAGVGPFEKDTLANIGSVNVTIDLMSVINGDSYKIKRIGVDHAKIKVKVLESGEANYDIAVESGETPEEPESGDDSESDFKLTLQDFELTNSNIIYDDAALATKVIMKGISHRLSGDLTAESTLLRTYTKVNEFTVDYEGVTYLNKTKLTYDADINADLKNEIYTLDKNELRINDLFLAFDGSVAMLPEGYNLVLTFNAPKTDFKNILSLVPAVYTKDFATVQTSGKLSLDGFVKGVYSDTELPSFNIELNVADAMFKYPDLPKSVENINISTKISSPGGDADNTVVEVSNFHLEMAGNPFDMKMLLKTPVSDPDIKGKIKGVIDLASVKDFYPLEEGEKLSGIFTTDVTIEGKLSAVENEQYEDFTAIGSMLIKKLNYKSLYFNEPVSISNAQLNFSPRYLDLVAFKSKIGKNDFYAEGKIQNYLAYTFKDETLSGELTTSSEYFNVSDLMPESEGETETTTEAEDTTAYGVVEIPGNINFSTASSFKKLFYDNIEMSNVNGRMKIKDKKLTLDNLSMNVLDGEMSMNGEYNSSDPAKPAFDFNLNINDVDIQKAYSTFDMIGIYAPIAAKTSGKLSTNLNMNSELDQSMMPIYETLNGGGILSTSKITISGVNTLDKIADAIKYDKIKKLVLDKIKIKFEFVDGKVLVEPFDVKAEQLTANISGWTALDQSINYTMNLSIPRSEFGQAANDVLKNLVNQANAKGANFSLGETVSLNVLIGGTITDPTVKTAFKESGKSMVEDVKNQIKQEVEKKKEELSEEARQKAQKIINDADAQAKKLIAEAEKQADQIRKTAAESAKKIREEADKQAKKLEDEGKKKGFLAEAAAKESAKKVRSEADKQANNVVSEADKRANDIVNKAKQEAASVKEKAQQEADKILKGN